MHREAKFTHDLPIQPYNKGIKWQTESDRERKKMLIVGQQIHQYMYAGLYVFWFSISDVIFNSG